MDSYTELWFIRLVEWLIDQQIINIERERFKCLKRNFHGGGSPTLAWLDKMATDKPEEQVLKLRECARINNRGDVLQIIQNIPNDALIAQLNPGIRALIADCLDERIVAAPDWSSFASHFGYGYKDRQKFQAVRIAPNKFSPTNALLDILLHDNVELSLDHIINWARTREAGRNDIGDLLEEFKTSLANRNQAGAEVGNQVPIADADDVDPENVGIVMNPPQNLAGRYQPNNGGQDAVAVRPQAAENSDRVPGANGQDVIPPRDSSDGVDELAGRVANANINDGEPGEPPIGPDGEPDLS